jgi:hypothetical protein
MTGLQTFARKWKNLACLAARVLLLGVSAGAAHSSFATGFSGPRQFLDDGGKKVDGSPQFFWELEVKRLARDFKPTEKRVLATTEREPADKSEAPPQLSRSDITAEADVKDFALAIKEGQLKPVDPAKATQQHDAARKFLSAPAGTRSGPLPEEFASEFSDYHRGALAYSLGSEHWAEAKTHWEGLLKRPAEERHYRTVWATFMMGKIALKSGDSGAVKWFQQTRALAKEGFADSLGMAADSYGWEGRSEWKQGHPEKAAPLFLTQLALGDESAVVSLKALIPDRTSVEGMLNYGEEPDEAQALTDEQKRAQEKKTMVALKAAANDPLLRRLETAHILATEAGIVPFSGGSEAAHVNRCARWLAVIKEAKPDKVEDAEYIGWVAYTNGDYKGAAHWLELGRSESPASCWLRAKLQRRAGKLQDAVKSMAQAWQGIHRLTPYTGWTWTSEPRDEDHSYTYNGEGDDWSFEASISGDLGALHLARADFVEAMDIFLKGQLWNDAAFIAERVLTTDELTKYVDQMPATAPDTRTEGDVDPAELRNLLGRRLVREDRYEAAARYLTPPYDKLLQTYVKSLKNGADTKLSKADRAQAWFTAAWLARYDGMELMGTEVAPDVFVMGGDFEITDLAKQRQSGKYQTVVYDEKGEKTVTAPLLLKPSKQELQRLAKNKIVPDVRFHYRVIAGALALRAAGLLADNSEELADVVNKAGLWVKERDEKVADSYYLVLKKRGSQTTIGRAALEKRWFVDEDGPWSKRQQEEHKALLKTVGLDKSE